MYTIYILTLVLFLVNILHAGVLSKIFEPLICSWLLPDLNWKENERFNPSTDRFKLMLSITFFSAILLLFHTYKNAQIKDLTIHYIFISLLIMLSVFIIYFNKYKIWSKLDRTVPNKKNKTDLALNSIQNTLNNLANTISLNNKQMNYFDKELLNTKSSLNQEVNKTLKLQDDFEIINGKQKKINAKVEQIQKEITLKRKHNEEKQNKSYESYFESQTLFQNTETLLKENNFYANKKNLTGVKLSILTYKLDKLKVIKISKKNTHFCKALEKQFGVKVDEGLLSRITKSLRDHSAIPKHNDILKEFVYLDKLK